LDRHDTNDILREGRNKLGILDTFQLAGYFPLDLEDEAVGSRKLTDLAEIPRALDVLEAISVGKRNKAVAAAAGITGPAVRGRLAGVEGAWGEDGLMSVRIANAIRARYVRALESRSGRINSRNISRFTLSSAARLEPSLINAFPDLGVAAAS
jgi:hypothetical protein